MSTFVEALAASHDFRHATPASPEQIARAQERLGLTFAEEYARYLATYGCAICHGHEFTGIGPVERLDVTGVTAEARRYNREVPADWYAVEETGVDGIVVWQAPDGAVFAAAPGDRRPTRLAASLASYLRGGDGAA